MVMQLFESYSIFPKESCIYKITCISTGRFYIGAATSFRKRMKDHRNYLVRGEHISSLMQKDFDEFGKESFTTEILKSFNKIIPFKSAAHKEVLLKNEEFYITSLKPAYNTQMQPYSNYSDLGNSIPIYQYDLEGNFIKEWKSQAEVTKVLGFNPQAAFTHQSAGGFQWSKQKVNKMSKYRRQSGIKSRKVCSVYDLLGNKIKTFNSIVDLSDFVYGTHNRKTQLRMWQLLKSGRGIHNKYRVAYGEEDTLDNTQNAKLDKRFIVVQLDLCGNLIRAWETLATAIKELKLKRGRPIIDSFGNICYKMDNYIFKKLGS